MMRGDKDKKKGIGNHEKPVRSINTGYNEINRKPLFPMHSICVRRHFRCCI